MLSTIIDTPNAPTPAPIFHQGVRRGPLLQVSGQGPQDPATGEYLHPGDVKAQALRTLNNVLAILEAGGATLDDVIMFRVYLARREDFAAMNEVYGQFVKAHTTQGVLPCRTTLVTGLPREEMLIEIDALAVTGCDH